MKSIQRTKIEARNGLYQAIRDFFGERSYLEVQTPIAVPCPGAEVHLEYFKTHWLDYHYRAHPQWLRSSPELHLKKLLAAEDLSRIFEIAPCFRNGGEHSQWHHPEFTMLEWYQKGISFRSFIEETLAFLSFTAERLQSPWAKSSTPFTWLTLEEVFAEFVGIQLIDQDPELAAKAKACGVYSVGPQDDFETAFFKVLLEKIEPQFQALERVVLYDYPPSQAALAKVEGRVAKRFEVYVAGVELCNGFFEATDVQDNRLRFQEINAQRKLLGKELLSHDEDFFQALATPIPPCCGNALGLDRWLALLLGASGLDDVLLFR